MVGWPQQHTAALRAPAPRRLAVPREAGGRISDGANGRCGPLTPCTISNSTRWSSRSSEAVGMDSGVVDEHVLPPPSIVMNPKHV
jgi:hypothetical protein